MFLAKFECLLFEADITTWPDTAKISLLYIGLSQILKAKLAHQIGLSTNYPEFVYIFQILEDYSIASLTTTNTYQKNSFSIYNKDVMDIGTVNIGLLDKDSTDPGNHWDPTIGKIIADSDLDSDLDSEDTHNFSEYF